MTEKRKDFTLKKKEKENCSKKTQFWIGMYISLIFLGLEWKKLRTCFRNSQPSANGFSAFKALSL